MSLPAAVAWKAGMILLKAPAGVEYATSERLVDAGRAWAAPDATARAAVTPRAVASNSRRGFRANRDMQFLLGFRHESTPDHADVHLVDRRAFAAAVRISSTTHLEKQS